MKIISLYSQEYDRNVYICGKDGGGEAFIVDPAAITRELIDVLTFHRYELTAILITHPEPTMTRAVKTISRIYDVTVYGGMERLGSRECSVVEDEEFVASEIPIQPIPLLPYGREARVFHVNGVFFTGKIIHAGAIGTGANAYAQALMVAMVRDHMVPYGEQSVILPGTGPATTLRAEINLTPFYRAELDI